MIVDSFEEAWEMFRDSWAASSPKEAFFAGAYSAREMIYARLKSLNLDEFNALYVLNAELNAWREKTLEAEEADDGRTN